MGPFENILPVHFSTSLASNLRALGDYDTQTQLLEFLLHVIPSARRRPFAEQYIHPDLAGPFCDIIGQNFGVVSENLRFAKIIVFSEY